MWPVHHLWTERGGGVLERIQNLVLYLKDGKTELLQGVYNVREEGDQISFEYEQGEKEFQMQDIVCFSELEKIEKMVFLSNTLEEIVQEMVEERLKESAQKIFNMGMLTAYMSMSRS